MGDVDVDLTFGFKQPVRAVFGNGDEVGLVVPEVGAVVGILDRKAELGRQFRECLDVAGVLEEFRELFLDFVVAWDQVKDATRSVGQGRNRPRAAISRRPRDSVRAGRLSHG